MTRTLGVAILGLLTLLTAARARAGDAFVWGVNGHPLSQAIYIETPLGGQLDQVAALGVNWYHVDWPVDAFFGDTARWDELVEQAAARKIKQTCVDHFLAGPTSSVKRSKFRAGE